MALENPGMSAFWDEVSTAFNKINVENESCKKLIAAKPIIATKFMTRVSRSDTYGGRNLQVHLRSFYQMVMDSSASNKRGQGGCQSPPKNIFKFWPTDFITHGQWQ